MTSVGEDFPRQVERVRKLWATYPQDSQEAELLDAVLFRASEAQASGDLLEILRSYSEISEVGLPPMRGNAS